MKDHNEILEIIISYRLLDTLARGRTARGEYVIIRIFSAEDIEHAQVFVFEPSIEGTELMVRCVSYMRTPALIRTIQELVDEILTAEKHAKHREPVQAFIRLEDVLLVELGKPLIIYDRAWARATMKALTAALGG